MKIAYLVPGTGGAFYCGNCHRDRLFVTAMKNNPEVDVTALPLYLLPNRDNFGDDFETNVFFGAISLYVKEKVPAMRNMPRFIEKILDSPPLLKFAARMAGSTTPGGYEQTTLDMITGQNPFMHKETEKLLEHLYLHGKPDIVHLSNALIIGIASHIKELTGIPVFCSLQNEDDWIEEMKEPYRTMAWKEIGKSAEKVDKFIASSTYYKDLMVKLTGISADKIEVIHPVSEPEFIPGEIRNDSTPSVGFFSRLREMNGLDKFIDASLIMKKTFPALQIHLSGGFTAADKKFLHKQIGRVKKAGYGSDIHFYENFTGDDKERFFRSIDLMSVPVKKPDAWGQYLLESINAGVPVVQPSSGAFPEIVSLSGGGVIYEKDDAEGLAEAMSSLLSNRSKIESLRQKGIASLKGALSPEEMKARIAASYRSVLDKKK